MQNANYVVRDVQNNKRGQLLFDQITKRQTFTLTNVSEI